MEGLAKFRGKLALALVAHGPGNGGHTFIAFPQQPGGGLHAVLPDMGGNGVAVDRLKGGL